jgi:hypothetical protein
MHLSDIVRDFVRFCLPALTVVRVPSGRTSLTVVGTRALRAKVGAPSTLGVVRDSN